MSQEVFFTKNTDMYLMFIVLTYQSDANCTPLFPVAATAFCL